MKRFLLYSLNILLIVTAPLLAFAESDAGRSSGSRANPARNRTDLVTRKALSAEEKVLEEIQVDAQSRVAELARQIERTPDEATRRALQARGVEIKRDSRLRMLRAMAAFARKRGDLPRTSMIEAQIESILHPGSKAIVNPESAAKKGGR